MYRISIYYKRKVIKVKNSMIIILITTAILMIMAYAIGGTELIIKGLNISVNTAIKSALMLVVSFIVIGQLQVLLSKELLDKWLQKFSGIKGILVSAIAGGLFPGGPYIYYPFISSLIEKELSFYIFITFIFGKHIYDFARIPMEVSLINSKIALIRNLITIPIRIIVGLLAKRFYNKRTMEISFMEAGEKNDSINNPS